MTRTVALVVVALSAGVAPGQGFTPDEAVKRMKLPPGFTARCVAAEPMIRQPVSMSFDDRGRLWVLQYLQYPNPAGLTAVKRDQFLRTTWDKVPEPPPAGPKGADRLTVCYDPDDHGVFRKSKDFVTGLNLASGFCLGTGGVYVVQPPYLLYYPDKNDDDVPDGPPEVLLSGFGMEDPHAYANSLQWGPDGWLYGAQGSTVTAKIKNPADAAAPPAEFQQGVWRYLPKTKAFELFAEGGGNTWGLDFDRHGEMICGTNFGGFACLHMAQGAYYVKGWAKHGPLHNPHAYGFFNHVPYTGFQGGHVTCGGVLYDADVYPLEYQGQYVAGNLLSNAVHWHRLTPDASSFKASHGGTLIEGNDTWFRPVDLTVGPDGCVYIADWYDKRANHVDPVDNWDRTNGRVYRIEYHGGPAYPTFDLRTKSAAELVELLNHPNKWWRAEARRLLATKADKATQQTLRDRTTDGKGVDALEALWALHQCGGWDEALSVTLWDHTDPRVRAWAVRLLGDTRGVSQDTAQKWRQYAAGEENPVVLAQLACAARRLSNAHPVYTLYPLLNNPRSADDPRMELLVWWAFEEAASRKNAYLPNLLQKTADPLVRATAARYARRLMAAPDDAMLTDHLAVLLKATAARADPTPVLEGMAEALKGKPLPAVSAKLADELHALRAADPKDWLAAEVLARMSDPAALRAFRDRAVNPLVKEPERVKAMGLVAQVRDPAARDLFVAELPKPRSDALRVGLLAGLEAFDNPDTADLVLTHYAGWSAPVKQRAVQLLLARPAWALVLFTKLDAGTFPKTDVTLDHARTAVALNDAAVTALVEKQFGRLAAATAGEKLARINSLDKILGRTPGDPARGKVLFAKSCIACHTLHGEGGKVGPDLTAADRRDRKAVLTNIIDPSAYIRPEYVVQSIVTTDARKLSGVVAEQTAEAVTLVNLVNDLPVRTVVARRDIEEMAPSSLSLMPDNLLDGLDDAQVGDLIAYVQTQDKTPGANAPGSGGQPKKLKVCLVSGSLEYKSDETLTAFKKYLEETFAVECTLVSAKAEKDKELAGLDALDTCDVAVFFTRRLQIEGESLAKVKKFVASGKPVIGIRTASHGFQNYLEMDKDVFGGSYGNHYGAKLTCDVSLAATGKLHPVLSGVRGYKSNASLYKNPNVAADCVVLLTGTIPDHEEPVAWVREKDGRRVFYTSLGHPDDFADESFKRLLVNALAWTTKSELVPAKK